MSSAKSLMMAHESDVEAARWRSEEGEEARMAAVGEGKLLMLREEHRVMLSMKTRKSRGERTAPCGTPAVTVNHGEKDC
jgi:hypothetical protein